MLQGFFHTVNACCISIYLYNPIHICVCLVDVCARNCLLTMMHIQASDKCFQRVESPDRYWVMSTRLLDKPGQIVFQFGPSLGEVWELGMLAMPSAYFWLISPKMPPYVFHFPTFRNDLWVITLQKNMSIPPSIRYPPNNKKITFSTRCVHVGSDMYVCMYVCMYV